MYGNGPTVLTGGIGGAGLLATTGSGGIILPIVVATLGLAVAGLLGWRATWLRHREQAVMTAD